MKNKKAMYVETITWWDDLVPESFKVAIPAYGLTIQKVKRIDAATTEVTVAAKVAGHLKEFLDDHEEGDYRELDVISLSCKTDEAYIKAMLGAIQKS